jgi:hypothetical protein
MAVHLAVRKVAERVVQWVYLSVGRKVGWKADQMALQKADTMAD